MSGIGEKLAAAGTNVDNIKLRLGQLLRDKAASKARGDDVEGSAYGKYNLEIRRLREQLKGSKGS
jgi:hypothetical protein